MEVEERESTSPIKSSLTKARSYMLPWTMISILMSLQGGPEEIRPEKKAVLASSEIVLQFPVTNPCLGSLFLFCLIPIISRRLNPI